MHASRRTEVGCHRGKLRLRDNRRFRNRSFSLNSCVVSRWLTEPSGQPPADKGSKPLRSQQAIACGDMLRYLRPVDLAQVKAEADPSPWPNVRRPIEHVLIRVDQQVAASGQCLEANRDNPIAVMIMEIVGELLL